MIYNKDLFDTAGIATVPTTGRSPSRSATVRVVNAQGQIAQSALALGGSETSIPNASDIIFLLMMQNGAQMTSIDGSSVTFATGGNSTNDAGLNAFNYYLQFANANGSSYTWNDGLGDALASFTQGKTAAIFDYSSALAKIKAKAPVSQLCVAAMPQPANTAAAINYAKYNVWRSRKTARRSPARGVLSSV